MNQMKLKARTTYRNGLGREVCIAGLARRDDQQRAFWSIQGDHYTEEGLLIWEKPLPKESARNIVEEVNTPEARKWWEGVETR